jgi:hypothetical protein
VALSSTSRHQSWYSFADFISELITKIQVSLNGHWLSWMRARVCIMLRAVRPWLITVTPFMRQLSKSLHLTVLRALFNYPKLVW